MKEKSTLIKGSFWIFSNQILTKLISFIYTVIIARLLVQEEIGAFYLVLGILGIFYIFTDLGLVDSLSRYVPYLYGRKEFGKLRSLIKLCYFGGTTLTLIFSIAVFFLSGTIAEVVGQPAIKPIMEMMAIWLVMREIDGINRGILIGRKRMKEPQMLNVVQNFSKLIITVIAFYIIGFNAEALSIGFLISFLLILPPGAYFAVEEIKKWKQEEKEQSWTEQWKLGKEVVSFGIAITLIGALWTIMQSTDKIMIGYFIPEDALAQVAVYSIAIGLANLILIFPTAISGIFFPIISELYGKKEKKEMTKTTNTSIKWTIIFMVPIVIIMSVFADNLLALFYGSLYEAGALVLLLFVIGLFIQSLFSLPVLVLAAMRRVDVELQAAGAAAFSNIILNLFLIPLWGINGAALASALSLFIAGAIIWHYSRKIFDFKIPIGVYKPIIAAIAAVIVIFLLKGYVMFAIDNYVPSIHIGESSGQFMDEVVQKAIKLGIFGAIFALSCIAYFIALLLLKAFGKEETELLEAGLRKAKIPEEYIGKILSIFRRS